MSTGASGRRPEVIEGRRPGRGHDLVRVAAVIGVAVLAGTLLISRAAYGPGAPPSPSSAPAIGASPAPSAEAAAPVPNALVPPTRAAGDAVVMPVTFPDGSTSEVRYPRRLGLAQLGVRPVISARMPELAGRELFAPPGGEAWFVAAGGVRLRALAGAEGTRVSVWRGNRASDFSTEYLVFGFGRWRVAVADDGAPEMLFDERTGWAANLRGRETRDGFLVLDARRPLRLGSPGERVRGVPAGPQLWFGRPGGPEVRLVADPECRTGDAVPNIGGPRPEDVGAVCRGPVLVVASGDRRFVAGVLEGVRVGRTHVRG